MSGDSSQYRGDIDGLRAIAVVPVILFHLGVRSIPGGFVGVDIFFVISGYLITVILEREIRLGTFSLIAFYERRARRILPVLAAVLMAVLATGAMYLAPHGLADLGNSSIATSLFASNIFFWRSIGYFEVAAEARPLLHTWSLAVEEQFYLLFPLVLIVLERAGRLRLPMVLASVALSFGWALALRSSPASFYLLPSRAFELGLGALLALGAIAPMKGRWRMDLCGLLGLAAMSGAMLMLTNKVSFPGPWALMPALGAAFVLYSGADRRTFTSRLLALPPLRAIGLISYSAYMWHWPMIVAARFMMGGPPSAEARAFLFVGILLIAAVSWRYIERPFRNPAAFSRRTIFVAGASALSVAIAVGALFSASNGLPGRFPFGPTPAGAESVRLHQCFLEFSDPIDQWSPAACRLGATHAGAPVVFVWGDSFAAHYVPGLVRRSDDGEAYAVVQANFAACPPLLGNWDRVDQRCAAFNERVMATLEELKPQVVVLAASWSYARDAYAGDPDLLGALLKRTIARVRLAGASRVVIVGDSPRYHFDVEQINLSSPAGLAIPRNTDVVESVAARANWGSDVVFVSPMATLCYEGQCRFRDEEGRILQWDDGHFTIAGSDYMVRRMLGNAIGEVGSKDQ